MMECNKICKMQEASLQILVQDLKTVAKERAARYMLRDAIKMLDNYNCDAGKALIKRMETCKESLFDGNYAINSADRNSIHMLIAEIEAFLNN